MVQSHGVHRGPPHTHITDATQQHLTCLKASLCDKRRETVFPALALHNFNFFSRFFEGAQNMSTWISAAAVIFIGILEKIRDTLAKIIRKTYNC